VTVLRPEKIIRKVLTVVCSLIIGISLLYFSFLTYEYLTLPRLLNTSLEPDRTNSNINMPLTRKENWVRLLDTPLLTIEEMKLIDGSTATIPITAELYRQFFNYSDKFIDINRFQLIEHNTTHYAYENLILSAASEQYTPRKTIIFVTEPSKEELEMAASHNVELDVTPICRDAFVFIVNKSNPVDSLTVEQIQKIYTGEITNWKEVGGPDLKIEAFQREKTPAARLPWSKWS